jgi:rod shape-determining protein MreD
VTRLRVVAALAAMLSALVVQAGLVGPVTVPLPVSLPAILVAAVALADGPGAGMSFGFAAGLLADLGSRHPAGVLALVWLGLGRAAGQLAGRRSVRADAAAVAVLCAAAVLAGGVLLTVLHADGATLAVTLRGVVPAGLIDAVLALVVVPLVRRFLAASVLRPPAGLSEIVLGGTRG